MRINLNKRSWGGGSLVKWLKHKDLGSGPHHPCKKLGEARAGERVRWIVWMVSAHLPAPTWQLTTICNCSPRVSDTHFWPQRALDECAAQTCRQAEHLHT